MKDSILDSTGIEDVTALFETRQVEIVDNQRAALIAAYKEAKVNREKAEAVIAIQGGNPVNLDALT